MTRPLKVWLVEYPNALPDAAGQEGRLVRQGVQTRLQSWFRAVVRHRDAQRALPAGFRSEAVVAWTSAPSTQQVDDRDLVIHFDASAIGSGGQSQAAQSPVIGPYRAAAAQLSNAELRNGLCTIQWPVSGGKTVVASVGSGVVPILSVVFAYYDPQFSNAQLRVSDNVERFCVIAFHEAAHNKDRTNSLHSSGGGGIFADIHTGGYGAQTQPNRANTAFLAARIWTWGPQYLVGRSLTPVASP